MTGSQDTFLQRNLQALHQRFPRLAERISSLSASDRVTVLPTPSGLPTLEVTSSSGKQVLYHSRHDPRREASRWATAPKHVASSHLVLFGLGLGYPALALLESSRRQYLCIYEPRLDVCRVALEHIDLRPLLLNQNVELVWGEPPENLYKVLFTRMGQFLSTGLRLVELPAAVRACPQEAAQVRKEIERLAAAASGMLRHMEATGYQIQRHILLNIPAIYRAHPPSAVKGLYEGRPALVVAAGPSLDKNRHLIPRTVHRAAIIATDTSYGSLLELGVEPQFVVTKDPSQLNERHFAGIDSLNRTVLVFDPQVSPRLISRLAGLSIFLPHRCHALHAHLPGRHLADEDILPFSQNVAIAAFHVARALGCRPVVFVGLDLAFPPQSGRSHASGSALRADISFTEDGRMVYRRPEGTGEFRELVETIQVPSIDGSTVPTTANFYEAIRYLEIILARCDIPYIDATEGGALIRGTQILTLHETIHTHMKESFDPWQPLDSLRQRASPAVPPDLFGNLATIVKQAGERASRALSEAPSAAGEIEPGTMARLLEEFRSARATVEEGFRLYQILEVALERLFVTIRSPGYFSAGDDYTSLMRAVHNYQHYFREIDRACATFGPLLDELAQVPQGRGE